MGLPDDASQEERDYKRNLQRRNNLAVEESRIVKELEKSQLFYDTAFERLESGNVRTQRGRASLRERLTTETDNITFLQYELGRVRGEIADLNEILKPSEPIAPAVVEEDELRMEPVVVTPKKTPAELEKERLEKLDRMYAHLGTSTEEFGFMLTDSFGGMYDNLLDKTKDFGDVLDEAFGQIFYNIGKDLFDKYIAEPLSDSITNDLIPWLFGSFEGGGFTGSGPRTGGIDGKGGFPAILHRDEVVTDLRNPESVEVSQAPNVTVIQNMDFRNADDATVARLQQAIPQIAEAASVRVKQELAMGGDLYRFTSGVR